MKFVQFRDHDTISYYFLLRYISKPLKRHTEGAPLFAHRLLVISYILSTVALHVWKLPSIFVTQGHTMHWICLRLL